MSWSFNFSRRSSSIANVTFESLKVDTMKVVPSPISATKATPHARHGHRDGPASSRSPSTLPRHAIHVEFIRPQPPAAILGNHRPYQHIRRNSGSKHSTLDAKVNKPTSHRTKVGLWLDNLETSQGPPSPTLGHHSPPSSARRKSISRTTIWPHGTKITRNANSPRIPLADITSLVLAADSPTSFYASDIASVRSQSSKGDTYPTSDLSGAVDMLTGDEAKQLLLLSAQSNMSLADAIKGIAISRSQIEPTQQVHHDYLADTFRFDEHCY
ncbi:hypothetical protein B0I37DRAFT_193758 [Chaetomium sp. MPI-CAGE-AT-0009]|nr:hypothetical protein B0I37DRAFT_193758 [Chaetomium sp. MPI-CAGE-AT-0009]